MRNSDEPLNGLTPADRELESALRGLSPAPVTISRDRLMFQAGEATGRRAVSRWRNAAAALVIVNVGLLSFSLNARREPAELQLAQTPVAETRPDAPDVVEAPSPVKRNRTPIMSTAYVSLRDDVLTRGLSALPASQAPMPAETPITVEQLIDAPRPARGRSSPWNSFQTFLFSGENL